MNLASIDHLAVNHHCWLQRCSPLAKVIFLISVLALLLTTRSLPFIAGLASFLLMVVAGNGLPLSVILPLAFMPLVFASIFAISVGDWAVGLLIIGRAGVAALMVATVFVTTPPVRLLALLSAPMPGVFAELLFFTYRSFFLIAGTLENTIQAVKLRRGNQKPGIARIRAMAPVYGMILVRAWDMAARQYSLLRLRGLEEGLKVNRDWRLKVQDLGLLAAAIIIGAGWYFV